MPARKRVQRDTWNTCNAFESTLTGDCCLSKWGVWNSNGHLGIYGRQGWQANKEGNTIQSCCPSSKIKQGAMRWHKFSQRYVAIMTAPLEPANLNAPRELSNNKYFRAINNKHGLRQDMEAMCKFVRETLFYAMIHDTNGSAQTQTMTSWERTVRPVKSLSMFS